MFTRGIKIAFVLPAITFVVGCLSSHLPYSLSLSSTSRTWKIRSEDGELQFEHRRYSSPITHGVELHRVHPADRYFRQQTTFRMDVVPGVDRITRRGTRGVAVDYALVTLLSAAPALLLLLRNHRRRRDVPRARCPICGYDTRATPHRCPECGTTPLLLP